ncbi:MAG: GNAT family N-acetyltransferase [Acidobacteria bacterium]|nr:GNAT family N-acetyltransferase [Acidobacteriota bacterium]
MFRIITEGTGFREHVLLKDGLGVLLRPATPEDVPLVKDLLGRVSRESLQMRFMATISEVPHEMVVEMCSGDFTQRGCLLAIAAEEENERVIGLGDYVGYGDGRTAEVSFLVDDSYQGRGIGTLILERLAGIAAAFGYVEFEAEVLWENRAMINVFRSSGFDLHQGADSGVIHVEFPVDAPRALRERGEIRERIATANSLMPLLRPRTVAVVGASRETSSIGNMIFRHILHARFEGTVYPVNNHAESVHGVRAYPSLQDLPEPVDLVVVAVPAKAVAGVTESAAAAGAKGLVIVSAGFAETGPEGAQRQQQLVELVRRRGIRLVGPNCLGIINTDPEVHLNASLAPELPPCGRVGFFSHSGGLGLVILEHAAARGIGFSSFVSAGNRADVSGNDILQYWEEDPNTDMALLYLETFGNPRKFARIARRFAHRKPILCVKSARSAAGQVAASGRTRGTFGSELEVEALFRQAGIIRAETLDEMFDVAVLLTHQPLPRGNRVAIVCNSRGVATLFADASEAQGLEISGPGILDLGPLATPEAYEGAVKMALENEEVDSLLVSFVCVGERAGEPIARAIHRGYVEAEKNIGFPKPTLLCFMGLQGALRPVPADRGDSSAYVFPSYLFPESAPKALGKAVRYAAFRRRKAGMLAWYEGTDAAAARAEAKAALEDAGQSDGLVWVQGERARTILASFGIPVAGFEKEDPSITLTVRPDPYFGPLIELFVPGTRPVIRITPLTDQDIEETVAAAGIRDGEDVAELLGRISQLIEEVPWLAALRATLRAPLDGSTSTCSVVHEDVRIGLSPAGFSAAGSGP